MGRGARVRIAVLIPTYFRPQGLRRILQSIRDTVTFSNLDHVTVDAVVVRESGDEEAEVIAREYGALMPPPNLIPMLGAVYCWNTALAFVPDYDAYVLGSDDIFFMYGWLEECVKYMQQGYGAIGFNDNCIEEFRIDKQNCKIVHNAEWATHYLLTRDFIIQHQGGVMCVPYYRNLYIDLETAARAKKAGKFIHALNANIKHDRHETAAGGQQYKPRDKIFYDVRKRAGWPNDFPPIIGKKKTPDTIVLICNGPSLNKVPRSFLKKHVTFGLNKIWMLPLTPTYYAATNKLVIEQSLDEIDALQSIKFIREGTGTNGYPFKVHNDSGFSFQPCQWVKEGYSVTYVALQFIYWLGFKIVLIVGLDHRFTYIGKPNEQNRMGKTDPNHFDSRYFAGQEWQNPDLENSARFFAIAKEVFERDGRRIINLTEGTALDVFEKDKLENWA